MKKILLSLIVAVAAFGATEKEKTIAEYSFNLGMHVEKNKDNIVEWGRLHAFKVLKEQLEGVDCNIKPSENAEKEYYRGLCEFVNSKQNSLEYKKSTLEGMNAIAYAATSSKNPKYMCAFALTQYTVNEWNKADFIMSRVHNFGNNELCQIAKELPKTAIKMSLTKKEAKDECAVQK